MDLKQLTALVTVGEVGSVTRAAQLLHLVQPAVTRQIRMLEDEMGQRLFERTRHGMVPTSAGSRLIDRARRVLQEVERARAEIGPAPGGVSGTVTVGLLESTVTILAEPLAEAVADRYPGIALQILTAYSGHLQEWLDDGTVDMSLLYDSPGTPALSTTPLLREPLWVVGRAQDGLSPDRAVPWAEVWQRPLVLPLPGHGLRTLIDEARSATGGRARVVLETNSLHVQTMMAGAGRAWTVLPPGCVAAAVAQGRLSGAPVCLPDVTRSVVLARARERRASPPVRAVAEEVLRLSRDLVRSGGWPSGQIVPAETG